MDKVFSLALMFVGWWPSVLIMYVIALAVGLLPYLSRTKLSGARRFISWSVTVVLFAAATWKLTIAVWPWWPMHLWEEAIPVVWMLLTEPLFLFIEFLASFAALATMWILQIRLSKRGSEEHPLKGARRTLHVLFFVVILFALFVNSVAIAHLSRDQASGVARKQITYTKTVSEALVKDPERVTSDCIAFDQAIAKIVSQIYVMAWNDFPEIKLKAVSLHVRLLKGHAHEDMVWNVIQVGRETKDLELLPLFKPASANEPGSLVAAAILTRERKYCPDVNTQLGDCKYYLQPPKAPLPNYRSMVCFPLAIGGGEVFAGICLDGDNSYRWDNRLNELEQDVTNQASSVYDFLQDLRGDDRCIFRK